MCFWIAIVMLIVLIIGSVPAYSYSRQWGAAPSGVLIALLILLVAFWWLAWLPGWFYPHP